MEMRYIPVVESLKDYKAQYDGSLLYWKNFSN